jgi:hypothetical protein
MVDAARSAAIFNVLHIILVQPSTSALRILTGPGLDRRHIVFEKV